MLRSFSSEVFRRYALHVRLLWWCAPRRSLVCAALAVVAAAAGTAALVTTGRLVGSLPAAVEGGWGSPAADETWMWLVATVVLFVAAPVSAAALGAVGQAVSARYLVGVLDLTMEVATHPYGVAHLEDPRAAGALEAVARAPRDWLFVGGIQAGWTLLSIRLGGVGAFAVLAGWSWWAPVLLLVGWLVLSKAFGQWSSTIFDQLLDVTGNDRRRADYLRSLLTDLPSAKEVRIFGLTDWLLGRYVATWQAAMRPVWAKRSRGLCVTLLMLLVPLAATSVVVLLLARDTWAGVISGGAVVTYAQAAVAMSAFGPQQDPHLFLARTTSVVSKLARLRAGQDLPLLPRTQAVQACPAPSVDRPEGSAASIALRDVTFSYPSEDGPTLDALNLEIPAGQSVALVGVNGVGKSTLIKLLCGLYRPDTGSVRIDGADPGVDQTARRRLAVIFQDFVRYHLSLRDNVAMGASARTDHPPRWEKALADAGGSVLLADLAHGGETVLSPEYAKGTELSGGQWQRVALARAFAALRAGAGVLILDEPTSALDVRIEAALFHRFLARTRGVTTLLVSHRLSSVRHAERIVVLGASAGGGARVVEDGTHEDLLDRDGIYAELFTLQASRFTRGVKVG
ncbi:MAG: ATP-binding cassette domain-containing protein [Actinopolymorphaceae bacterium]